MGRPVVFLFVVTSLLLVFKVFAVLSFFRNLLLLFCLSFDCCCLLWSCWLVVFSLGWFFLVLPFAQPLSASSITGNEGTKVTRLHRVRTGLRQKVDMDKTWGKQI